jgi:hypothetical protein
LRLSKTRHSLPAEHAIRPVLLTAGKTIDGAVRAVIN